jgi:hypothetical protein
VEFPALFFLWAVELPATWRSMPKTPTKALQRAISEIAMAAEELAAQLETHQKEIAFHGGSQAFHRVMVRARTIRAELAEEVGAPDPWSYNAPELWAPELLRHPHPTVHDFLHALAAERRAMHPSSEFVTRPTKVADKNAERTFMVRALAALFIREFGDASIDVVVTTVNTILDAKDDLLDASHARKLLVGLL